VAACGRERQRAMIENEIYSCERRRKEREREREQGGAWGSKIFGHFGQHTIFFAKNHFSFIGQRWTGENYMVFSAATVWLAKIIGAIVFIP
jgi:hypothetical protein